MQTVQGNMLQSLRTVQAFLEENAEKLGGVVKTGARQRLDETIAALARHVSDQSGSHLASQGATQLQRTLRRVLLRDHMAPIARIAQADLPPTPEVEPLRMPPGKPTAERLAALAHGMATAAEPFAATFVSAGLPEDFIARLKAAADAMTQSLSERSQSRGRQSGATIGLKATLTAGRKIVRVLDAFVRTALQSDPALLGNWNAVRRVQKVVVRPNAPTDAVSPAPAPSATDPATQAAPNAEPVPPATH